MIVLLLSEGLCSALWGWLQQLPLAAQGWSHLGCSAVPGWGCSGRERTCLAECIMQGLLDPGAPGPRVWATEQQSSQGWLRMLRLKWLQWICTGSGKVNYSSRHFWHLRPSGERVCSCSRCGFAHPVSGIAVKMTQVNEGYFGEKSQSTARSGFIRQGPSTTQQHCCPGGLQGQMEPKVMD